MEPELASQLPLDLELDQDDTAAPVATFTDDATDSLDVLLGKEMDVDSITKLVAEPPRTPVDYSGEIDPETFDGEDDLITFVEMPAVPKYVEPSPARVEKRHAREGDSELAKHWKNPNSLKAWIQTMKDRGETRDSLVKFAEQRDPKMARLIAYNWDTLNEPEPEAA